MSRHENSPIFSLSSPDPICPIVYAGTTGKVYELEISEIDYKGNLVDPYFAAPPGAIIAPFYGYSPKDVASEPRI